jgi:hypothetical protein
MAKKTKKHRAKKTAAKSAKIIFKLPRRIVLLVDAQGAPMNCKDPEGGGCKDDRCPARYQCVTVDYQDAGGRVYKTECICMRTAPDPL